MFKSNEYLLKANRQKKEMLNHLAFDVFYGVREIQYTNPVRWFTYVRLCSKAKLRPFTALLKQ